MYCLLSAAFLDTQGQNPFAGPRYRTVSFQSDSCYDTDKGSTFHLKFVLNNAARQPISSKVGFVFCMILVVYLNGLNGPWDYFSGTITALIFTKLMFGLRMTCLDLLN